MTKWKTGWLGLIMVLILTISACNLGSFQSPEEIETDGAGVENTISNEENSTDQAETVDQEKNEGDGEPAVTASPEDQGMVPPPTSSDACANVLYPLIPGYQWVYSYTSEGETSQIGISVTEAEGDTATLTALYLDSGVTSEAEVVCEDGALVNLPNIFLGFLFGDVSGNVTVDHVDGVFIPSYQTFEEVAWKHQWVGNYTASGQIKAEVDGDQVTGTLEQSPIKLSWNTLSSGEDQFSFDPVSVSAGDYSEAIMLSRHSEIDLSVVLDDSVSSMKLSGTLILDSSLWFQPNQGLVKQQIDRASLQVGGIKAPIVLDGTLELVEFRRE